MAKYMRENMRMYFCGNAILNVSLVGKTNDSHEFFAANGQTN